ncbi:MAG: site-specific DNA-methyltransferase [Polyangiaceae bacterium]|nr:site-specific DNA-methyltransferase [Polyangiaceae bacterium]
MNEKAPPSPLLLHGDCLQTLPVITEKVGHAELIYVDPPYNAGGSRGARQAQGPRSEGEVAYRDAWGGLGGFLSMMKPRLAAMRDALSAEGSLWVHLDHRTIHDIKVLADQIFGPECFQGEVIWVPGNGGRRRNGPPMTHQTILIFSRTKNFIYNSKAPELREPYAETSRKMHFSKVDENGRRYRERVINEKAYRYYEDEGRMRGSVWSDIPSMQANTPLRKETTGYPTQKPEALLKRIIAAASLPNGLVIDPMCGSGTTLAAALKSGRRAAGGDISPISIEVVEKRLSTKHSSTPQPEGF